MKSIPIKINKNNPFENCQLNREQYAEILMNIIDTYPEGFVLAIDGAWGTGKTTFMQMFQKYLILNNHETAVFNAWENDFVSDPSVAILGEIKKIFDKNDSSAFKSIVDKVYRVSAKTVPILFKAALKKVGLEDLADIGESIAEGSLKEFDNEINEYDNKKNSLSEIRRELSSYIKDKSNGKPFVFIVDELDRCRPDYAVEVLEKIKHFFAVDGVVFILSVDKEQLSNSIKGYYGSDQINSMEYLRRFIDLEYQLPKPSYQMFLKYLFEKYYLHIYYNNKIRENHPQLKFPEEQYYEFFAKYCAIKKITLRQLEKIFAHSRIVTRLFSVNEFANPILVLYLIILKNINTELYNKIANIELDLQSLVSLIEDDLKDGFNISKNKYSGEYVFNSVLLYIICSYEISLKDIKPLAVGVFNNDSQNIIFHYADSKLITDWYSRHMGGVDIGLGHFTNKINLLENLKN